MEWLKALSSNSFCTSFQISMNGSDRVRPCTATGISLGSRTWRRYFRDVLASMPALAAAISRVPSVFTKANNLRTCLSVTNPPPLKSIGIRLAYCRRSGFPIVAGHQGMINFLPIGTEIGDPGLLHLALLIENTGFVHRLAQLKERPASINQCAWRRIESRKVGSR
jgi:hypothetical protein